MAAQKVVLIGAGLAGSLLSLYLAKRGYQVEVYERRPDMRVHDIGGGRSINLALSLRGIHALAQVGMADELLRIAIPMTARAVHLPDGQVMQQPYGRNDSYYINSVSRGGLNIALLNCAAQQPNISLHFEHRCTAFDARTGGATLVNEATSETLTVQGDTLIATDGAGSAVRSTYLQQPRFDYSQHYLQHGYKELHLPPNPDGSHQLAKHALHIWPRGQFMLIALPNLDGSFTCTLFLPFEAKADQPGFDALTNEASVMAFFTQHFPDVVSRFPALAAEFLRNPTGAMSTVKCYPWAIADKSLLLGDAAHAIVPFYGQGMNCAFEDCVVLDACIAAHAGDWQKIFASYQQQRKTDTDAIADLALGNFIEMRDLTADPVFQRKRKLELRLETDYPDRFLSKYSMVTFTRMPYSQALARGSQQDQVLMQRCAAVDDVVTLDAETLLAEIG